jgi:hypothetical protein
VRDYFVRKPTRPYAWLYFSMRGGRVRTISYGNRAVFYEEVARNRQVESGLQGGYACGQAAVRSGGGSKSAQICAAQNAAYGDGDTTAFNVGTCDGQYDDGLGCSSPEPAL